MNAGLTFGNFVRSSAMIWFSRTTTCLVPPSGCWMIETYSPVIPLPLIGISGSTPKSVIGVPSWPMGEMATMVKSRSTLV